MVRLLVKERIVSGFNASRTVILTSKTGIAVEERRFSKMQNWRHYLSKTRVKIKKNWHDHWEWLNKPFQNASKPWECSAWDQLGVVYYELLKSTETITGDRYRTQLMRLSRAMKDKRPQYNEKHDNVILQHDNARPMLRKWSRHTWKRWNGKSYLTRRILQTLLPLITCFDQWPGWPALSVLWRNKKLDRFMDSLKRWPVFSTRDLYATRKMGESSGQRWTILWIINV